MDNTKNEELEEISKLLELEHIHISEGNTHATYVGNLSFVLM